jgi:hypothetical protein
MKGGSPNKPQHEPDPANLSESELVSNQEATCVAWFCGTQMIAVTWISPVYNVYHKNAPDDQAKK